MKLTEINIFNLGNLVRLLNKGKVDEVYDKIYSEAEKIAVHEMQQYEAEKKLDEMIDRKMIEQHNKNMFRYKRERIEYHTNKMIELLKLSKEKSEKDKD